jgi:hypothetical protein
MKPISIVVVSNVQGVTIQWFVRMLPIALVPCAKPIYVFVSVLWLSISNITTSLIPAPVSCDDNVQNQDETDIDCGGTSCPKCNNTMVCKNGSDCTSSICINNMCVRKELIICELQIRHVLSFQPLYHVTTMCKTKTKPILIVVASHVQNVVMEGLAL